MTQPTSVSVSTLLLCCDLSVKKCLNIETTTSIIGLLTYCALLFCFEDWELTFCFVCPHMFYQIPQHWVSLMLNATLEKAISRLSTLLIICGWIQIWNWVRFIAPPLIIPPSHQNTFIIAVVFLLGLSSVTFPSKLSLCSYNKNIFSTNLPHCLLFEQIYICFHFTGGKDFGWNWRKTHLSSQHQWKYYRPCRDDRHNTV